MDGGIGRDGAAGEATRQDGAERGGTAPGDPFCGGNLSGTPRDGTARGGARDGTGRGGAPTGDGTRGSAAPAPAKPYKMRDLTATLNLSRSTLIYYEDLGIVKPHRREGSSYRRYDDADMFRVMTAIMLKNLGETPRDLPRILDDGPYSLARFDEYRALAARRAEYVAAQAECLERLRQVVELQGQVVLQDVEPFYIRFDAGEEGYGEFRQDAALDALLDNLPVGGLGSVYRGNPLDGECACPWGRTVAVRFAHLIPGLETKGLEVMGGCRCVVAFSRVAIGDLRGGWREEGEHRRVLDFLEERRLEVTGPGFSPYSVVSPDQGILYPVCIPVRERRDGVWGRVRRAFGA